MVIPHKNKWIFWGQLVITWTVAFLILSFLRNYGWPETEGFTPQFYNAPGLSLTLGIVVGTFYFLIELIMNRRRFRRMSFGQWAGVKSLFHFALILLLFVLVVLLYPLFSGTDSLGVPIRELLFSKSFLLILFYFSLVSLLITIFMLANQQLGRGILSNQLLGRYHHPREEERIFLFIDLRGSTTIAEKLGHFRFSRLIQDCFADITDAVIKHEAEIYQYIGDEVILCWKSKSGLKRNNCIEAFLHFMEILARRSDYYQNTYGLQPEFEAGAHVGRMMVAEVGIIKRELAYLGDVLNTAARIQGRCNTVGESFLISETLHAALETPERYASKRFSSLELTGKEEKMTLVAIQRP